MTAYYNEFNPEAAAWLRELIKEKLIAPGEVDERSIIDVEAKELKGYGQHHFFAGIGGWSYALRLAGWPDDRPVWTASLPCQPFSTAGKGLGKNDERHLLPHFLDLVTKCRPDVLFGEQVEGAIKHGWLDDLQTNMEAEGYAVGHCVLGAHSIGAPHIRQRLYWVADSNVTGLQGRERTESADKLLVGQNGMVDWMGDTKHNGRAASAIKGSDGAAIQDSKARQNSTGEFEGTGSPPPLPEHIGLHDTQSERRAVLNTENVRPTDGEVNSLADSSRSVNEQSSSMQTTGIDWIYCRDNKYRPIESGILPLAHGVPRGMVHSSDPNASQEARKMRLHGYGNAIVPQVAAEFITAFMEIK